jgi:glucokinase
MCKKNTPIITMDNYTHVAAVDLGATHARVGIVDSKGTVCAFSQNDVGELSECVEIQTLIYDMISDLVTKTGISPKAIGISTAGPVDLKTGSIIGSPNMKCDRIFLTEPLKENFGIPVNMMTDCKAGALGEYYFGGGKNAGTLVYLTFSTGIGAGVIENGKLLSGSNGNASEVGHFLVDTTWNLSCGCGGIGHWEAYSSGTGIPKFFQTWCEKSTEYAPTPLMTAGQILYAAEMGSPLCLSFCDELAKINGSGLSSVIAAYNPDLIILDGPVAGNYPSLIAKKMTEHVDHYLPIPEIRISTLEGKAPLLGAASLALKNVP